MADKTRDFAMRMRGGVRAYKEWKWGPFSVCSVIVPQGKQLCFNFMLYGFGLSFYFWA